MEDLGRRTKTFSIGIVRLFASLPKSAEAQVLGKQLLRCGTSVGAHYHEAIYAWSDSEFIAKIEGGLQELSETRYWLELLREVNVISQNSFDPLLQEAKELTAILITISKKTKQRHL